ncbi:hypothetical protein [Sphingomonas sp.]|uniref:hypothetical protein n=1 Tax=Sphingomonas sp. TaxID=28214 RepID=UPI003751B03D
MGRSSGGSAVSVAQLSGLGSMARLAPLTLTAPAAWSTAWTIAAFTPVVSLYEDRRASFGSVGKSAAQLFDLFSTARGAPGTTLYVNIASGNDTTGTGASGAPFQSIHKAVTAANTAGQPATVFVAAGDYPRANNPSNGGAVLPTVDLALIATGGRVKTGAYDAFAAPTADATYTNCYSFAVATMNRVLDRANLDRFGNVVELTNVVTAAQCNVRPGSWALVAGTLYINRADAAAVTNVNTRVLRSGTATIKATAPVSLFVGGQLAGDGFDLEGGSSAACLTYAPASVPAAMKAVVADGCSFRYAGGTGETGASGVAINSVHGLAALFNCAADANATDGFNVHNSTAPTAATHVVTVNCSASNNGRAPGVSCNGWTTHENVVGLDVAGVYRANRGGTMRSINTSRSWLAGSRAEGDMGDLASGGTLIGTALRVDDSARYWCDRVAVDMPAGTLAIHAATAGSAIFTRAMPPSRAPAAGAGTIGTY